MGCACSSEEQSTSRKAYIPETQKKTSTHVRASNRASNRDVIYSEGDQGIQSILRAGNQPNFEPFLQSKNDPYFNFPEIEGVYVGKGLKKMKGYVSNIPLEEVKRKRREFWQTRVEGNKETWEFLERVCDNPEITDDDVQAYLSAMDVKPYKDCINVVYDGFGGLFEIPNYCIHDPSKYDIPKENDKQKPPEEKINFVVKNPEITVKIKNKSNYLTIEELKEYIVKKKKKDGISKEQIRLFFSGKELKDENELWFYNISNQSNVLLMIRRE